MPDTPTRDAKLVQYLNEAYGKEKQLETALEAHIAMTTRKPYKRRLQEHLKETKGHARAVERRIKELGGHAEPIHVPGPEIASEAATKVQDLAQRGVALAQGPLHAVRGTGEQEKQLKNAKTEYASEAEEIATYQAIETLAETVGDKPTARLARGILRQEERMAGFLKRLIPQLTKAVAQDEIPAAERNGGRRTTRSRRTTTSRGKTTSRRATSSRRTSGSRRTTGARRTSGSAKTSGSRRSTARRKSSTGGTTARRKSTGRRTTARRKPSARRTTSRRATTRSRATAGSSRARS
jgi:ferritin-like metal-binding protein YciE